MLVSSREIPVPTGSLPSIPSLRNVVIPSAIVSGPKGSLSARPSKSSGIDGVQATLSGSSQYHVMAHQLGKTASGQTHRRQASEPYIAHPEEGSAPSFLYASIPGGSPGVSLPIASAVPLPAPIVDLPPPDPAIFSSQFASHQQHSAVRLPEPLVPNATATSPQPASPTSSQSITRSSSVTRLRSIRSSIPPSGTLHSTPSPRVETPVNALFG